MKKFLSLVFVVASLSCVLGSCSNDEEIYVPQEVELRLNYSLSSEGSMTRATGAEVFDTFYEKYIVNKNLSPQSYSLTFRNIVTSAVAEFNGYWSSKDGVRLIEGEYVVTGSSSPKALLSHASDSLFLSFQDTVTITRDMRELTLKANYNAFLVMFDAENVDGVYYNSGGNNSSVQLTKTNENIYYMFLTQVWNSASNFAIAHKDKKYSYIYLNNTPFKKGKYYYFNDMSYSLEIPKMESGN